MKRIIVKRLSFVLVVLTISSLFALSASATETVYDDGSYYRIENIYVGGSSVGYVEAMYLTRVVSNGIPKLQLGSEVRGGVTSSYRTTSETKIFTALVGPDEGGKLECVNLSSTEEGTRLLSATVTFTNCDVYASDYIYGWVLAECTNKSTGDVGGDIFTRYWNRTAWVEVPGA